MLLTLAGLPTLAAAQAPSLPPHAPSDCVSPTADGAPADFRVCGHLDAVVGFDPSGVLTTTAPVFVGGWVFECRSGLQPQTQRVGTIAASWWRLLAPQHGQNEQVQIAALETAERQDVANGYRETCPAVGPTVGLNLTIPAAPEAGIWNLDIVVTTTDGAGRCIEWHGRREGLEVRW